MGRWDLDGDGMANEQILSYLKSTGLGVVTPAMGLQVLQTVIEKAETVPPVFMVSPIHEQVESTDESNKWVSYDSQKRRND